MVFLHLLPSPSSRALRLTPKPPRILSQRRGYGVNSDAHGRNEAQGDPGRRGAAAGAPLGAGVAVGPSPLPGDLAGGAARSPPSLLRLLAPKSRVRGAGTCGSCLGPRGLARSPLLGAPASTPSFLFSSLPVSLPPPHLSVSFSLFPFPPFLVPFFSPISFKISRSYKKNARSLPKTEKSRESTLGNLPVCALSNLPLPFTHPCKTSEGLSFYRLALTVDSLAPLSPGSLPLSTSVTEYWVTSGQGWLHGCPRSGMLFHFINILHEVLRALLPSAP